MLNRATVEGARSKNELASVYHTMLFVFEFFYYF